MGSPRKPTTGASVRQPDPWLTIPQAAEMLGIATGTVRQRALLGELEFQKVAGRTFISRASVERVLESSAA